MKKQQWLPSVMGKAVEAIMRLLMLLLLMLLLLLLLMSGACVVPVSKIFAN